MDQQNTINRVKSDKQGFEAAFNHLPKDELISVRKRFMSDQRWSISLFYYKKRGDTPIWEHEVPVIESIFSEYKINPWTGQSTNN